MKTLFLLLLFLLFCGCNGAQDLNASGDQSKKEEKMNSPFIDDGSYVLTDMYIKSEGLTYVYEVNGDIEYFMEWEDKGIFRITVSGIATATLEDTVIDIDCSEEEIREETLDVDGIKIDEQTIQEGCGGKNNYTEKEVVYIKMTNGFRKEIELTTKNGIDAVYNYVFEKM